MGIQLIDLCGSPHQMGRAHGEQFRDAIQELADRRLEVCVQQATAAGWANAQADVLGFCARSLVEHERFSPTVYDEFRGIGEGADLSLDRLLVCNGLTDIIDVFSSRRDHQAGCTAWLAAPEATTDDHVLAGQTWDMHSWAEAFVVALRRRPRDAPASLALTTTGCLTLIGLNEAGIAIGNNNLKPTDAHAGVMYLAIIHSDYARGGDLRPFEPLPSTRPRPNRGRASRPLNALSPRTDGPAAP
jgi:isopenicillin-N N-acyltransferase-like protein